MDNTKGYRGEIMLKFRPTLAFMDKEGYGHNDHDYEGTDATDINTQFVSFNGRTENYPDIPEGLFPFMPRVYEVGERVGQIIIMPYPKVELEEADELSSTERGTGGYGSTGK